MKTSTSNVWKLGWLSLFAAVTAFRVAADEAPAPAPATSAATPSITPEKTYTGTVASFDKNEHVLRVNGWFVQHKTFNVGDKCVYTEPESDNLPMTELRPGERVNVSYQDRYGVLIADRVQQIPMRIEGTVTAWDPTNHTMTIHQTASSRKLWLADDCQVMLRNGKDGTLDDIKVGSYVTVTYETPNNMATVRDIAQTSQEFTGTLTALDLENRTMKAKAVFDTRKFNLADHCAIVINGQANGHFADLRPEERLVLSYDEINGVNVVNRIAPAEPQPSHVATTGPAQGY